MKIVAGNGCHILAEKVAKLLHTDLSETILSQFNDGEIHFEVKDHVRGDDVYIIQSTGRPANDNIMELAIMADALKRSASQRIIAVIPYYGYSRQDRRPDFTRTPITSRLVAELIQASGVDYVVTMDIHSEQQQGFFNVPFINLSASRVLIDDIWAKYCQEDINNVVIVSPDVGGVKRARTIAKMLDDAPLAIIDKRRPMPGVSEVHHIVGDVERKTCIMVDDMVDTAGTLAKASNALKARGAKKVIAYATHPVLSGAALQNLDSSEIDELVVTDTNPLTDAAVHFREETGRIRVVTIASMIAEAIFRIDANESISAMYHE